jgi:hypothetical protein
LDGYLAEQKQWAAADEAYMRSYFVFAKLQTDHMIEARVKEMKDEHILDQRKAKRTWSNLGDREEWIKNQRIQLEEERKERQEGVKRPWCIARRY